MDKIKGWRAEQRIDDYLHHDKVRSSMCESARLLIQAKTLIMTLREENKFLEKESKSDFDDYVEYYNRWLDADCELRKLKKQNNEILKQHQDYFVENEKLKQVLKSIKTQLEIYFRNKSLSPVTKSEMLLHAFYHLLNEKRYQDYFSGNENLKQELQDCIMSNELLDKENDRLRQSETEAKEIIAELESKLAEYEKFGLDKDLENLKRLK